MSKEFLAIHEFQSLSVSSVPTRVVVADSAMNITLAHSGSLIVLNRTSGSTLTMPTAVAGLDVSVVVGVTAANHSVVVPTGALKGSVPWGTFDSVATAQVTTGGSSVTFHTAGSRAGDRIRLTCDGTRVFLTGAVSRFDALTFA